MARLSTRLAHAWNAFTNQQQSQPPFSGADQYYGPSSYGGRPHQQRLRFADGKTIISSIYTRLGVDVASVDIRHVRLDDKRRYKEDIDSGLNNCLTVEANIDQAAQAFFLDVALSLFDEGTCAIVPVDTTLNPNDTGGFDIKTMRVGTIVDRKPNHVKVSVWNVEKQRREEVWLAKRFVAIVENPLYSVMNESNSMLQRLIRVLQQLDAINEQSSSGKLDLIIQLPYVVKTETKRQQAEQRRKDMEFQLAGSKYGVAYADATEKITQLNRPVENNLMAQVQYLTELVFGQLGLTLEILNGTADEAAMLNYNNRTIKPILKAIVQAMKRTFLTSTARTQGQSIEFFRNPFELVPITNIAEIADKFTRNEIFSSNEIRQFMGIPPAKDPKADQLVNSNMPQADTGVGTPPAQPDPGGDQVMQDAFDEVNQALDSVFTDLGVPLDASA